MKEQNIKIPVRLLGDPNLDGRNRLFIYCYIKSICDSGRVCMASNDDLAELLGTSNGTVRQELCDLKRLGYISVTKTDLGRELRALPVNNETV